MKIELRIKNLGHVPSFKNNKRAILDRKTGKMRTLTEPKTKQWMEDAIQSFVLQLLWASQTIEGEIPTGHSPHSWIASSLPLDDSWQWIPKLDISCHKVVKDEEGAQITIEKL